MAGFFSEKAFFAGYFVFARPAGALDIFVVLNKAPVMKQYAKF